MVGYEPVQLMVSRQVGHEREVEVVLPGRGRSEDRQGDCRQDQSCMVRGSESQQRFRRGHSAED